MKVNLFSFVFWKKLKTPKSHFEINWPLGATFKRPNKLGRVRIKSLSVVSQYWHLSLFNKHYSCHLVFQKDYIRFYSLILVNKKIFCCSIFLKFIYYNPEKATKFCEIFPLLLTVCTVVKSEGKISQNFVAFSEYMNFKKNLSDR